MKTEFKAKFLQHVAKRKKEEGFTLIELLVVIIIIGILSAIALPSFLNQANKAKESEAKQYLSSINKSQQAAYTEFSQFRTDINALGVGIKTQTENYDYSCEASTPGGVNCQGTARNESVRSYLGFVYLITSPEESGGETTSRSLLCQTIKPGPDQLTPIPAPAVFQANSEPTCPANMTDV
ncbi:MAG: type IV pilin-like G/H family protein [Cyanobacteria bacterium J06592_8]